MEAYFHNDPRIEEWVNQIIENLFTVCLLTGVDSEVEFQKGCKIVEKVKHLLLEISVFPSEYLDDGLKQILEQKLPDSRVINNFPTFQDTMNRMLREGMAKTSDIQTIENLKNLAFSNMISTENTKEDNNTREINITHSDENTEKSVTSLDDDLVNERVVTALALVNSTIPNQWEVEVKLQDLKSEEPIVIKNNSFEEIASLLVPPIPTKPYGIIRKTKVPEQADRLKQVLSNIFPNVSVCWNLNLMGQTFLAQVEDILICLDNPEEPRDMESLKKEGWKVFVCSSQDLMFPRRLERGIRQIHRLGKQSKNW